MRNAELDLRDGLSLLAQADRCRCLAGSRTDAAVKTTLLELAVEYELLAEQLRQFGEESATADLPSTRAKI